MEAVIREGSLRLQTSEASCDVILSCQGHRLMAHKVILSIASPMLRTLLVQDYTEPSVLIFPDINGNTMSLILDYMYTGSVVVYSNTIKDFLSAATLLKLHIDANCLQKCQHSKDFKLKKKDEDVSISEVFSKRNRRKLPSLVPLAKLAEPENARQFRRMSNCVIPSPWCPRMMPLLSDPRTDCSSANIQLTRDKVVENDANNNSPMRNNTFERITSNNIGGIIRPPENSSRELDLSTSLNRLAFEPQQRLLPRTFRTNHIFDKRNHHHQVNSSNNKSSNNRRNNSKIDTVKEIRSSALLSSLKKNSSIQYEPLKNIDATTTATKTTLPDLPKGEDTEEDEKDKRLIPPDAIKRETDDQHQDDKPKQKPFKCDDCGKCFSQLRNYKYHRSVHEGTKEFAAKCPECGKLFNDRGYLSSHMKIHRDKKEYACPHCPKRFNQRVAYNMHLRIHTGIKPHECPTCGKSFSRKMLLKQHQRVHTGERPYSCPECGKTFADRSNMSLHARLHTGVKPYACSLCPKSFTKKHHLKTHMNFHTGLKPYTCQKCGLAFSQSSNMRTHYKKCILKDSSTANSNGNGPSSAVLMENTDSNHSHAGSETK